MKGRLALVAVLSLVPLTTGAVAPPQRVARNGGTFRVAAVEIDSIDPALAGQSAYDDASCALLLRGAGKPEVALRRPSVSRDGRTYTFRLRKTFRFFTGTKVTAESFAHAFDRVLGPRLQSDAAQYFTDIVGAEDVVDGKATHARGVTARGYTLKIRLAHRAPDFPARLTQPYACAVPASLPADPEAVSAPFSGGGPYYVAEFVPGRRVLLRRNRYYRGSRAHHVGRIVVTIVADNPTGLEAVAAGRADWIDLGGGTAGALTRSQRARVHVLTPPALQMLYVVMNTSRPLFRKNVALRRAVNFALDRSAIVRTISSIVPAIASDQYLPAAMPGFRDAHIYPLDGPDVKRARKLAEGHLRRGRAVLYVANVGPTLAAARVVKRDLARIGVSVEVREFPFDQLLTRLSNLREPYDLSLNGWRPAYVDPYDFLNSLLDGRQLRLKNGGNLARFNSPKYNRLLRRAARLSGPERYRAYGKLDVQLARDAAPLAATTNIKQIVIVSRRTACVTLDPVGFLDLASVCLR